MTNCLVSLFLDFYIMQCTSFISYPLPTYLLLYSAKRKIVRKRSYYCSLSSLKVHWYQTRYHQNDDTVYDCHGKLIKAWCALASSLESIFLLRRVGPS